MLTSIHFSFVGTVYEVIQLIHLLLFEGKRKIQNVILPHNINLEIIGAIHKVCMLSMGGGGGGHAKIAHTYCLKRYILLSKCVNGVRRKGCYIECMYFVGDPIG